MPHDEITLTASFSHSALPCVSGGRGSVRLRGVVFLSIVSSHVASLLHPTSTRVAAQTTPAPSSWHTAVTNFCLVCVVYHYSTFTLCCLLLYPSRCRTRDLFLLLSNYPRVCCTISIITVLVYDRVRTLSDVGNVGSFRHIKTTAVHS
jgi:hypothetical protein